MQVKVAEAFDFLYSPARYKVTYGGRGGAKSVQYADALLVKCQIGWERILCTREFQSSIADSVYRLLVDRIAYHGWEAKFAVTLNRIINKATGAEFLFKGLRYNINEIKSTEGVTIVWVEESQSVSKESWDVLIPTIRREGSEIWVSFNTGEVDDPTYQRFVMNTPPNAVVKKVSYLDNPYFPAVLEQERAYCQKVDPDAYDNIWEGNPKEITNACIFKGKYSVRSFETPENARFYFGSDFGFSQDPLTLVRCFPLDNKLYVDQESWGVGVELNEIPEFYDSVPESRNWTIRADDSRPETISYLKNKGFQIIGAPKSWKNDDSKANKDGSVKEGIAYLRQYEEIVIHERCKHTADEFKFYAYKVDKLTGEVLPIILDAWNHCIDAIRYALQPLIRQGFSWENLI
jgi:phage terminase large subunit